VDDEIDQVLVAKVYRAEQEHVFRFWSRLDEAGRRRLLDQLGEIDLQQLGRLAKLIDAPASPPVDLAPDEPQRFSPERRAELAELGWEALRGGKVACFLVAGGQGTRLGWPHPKGTYPVGPVSGKSLYQLFAEQLIATGKRAGRPLDLYVLTSRDNTEATQAAFREHDHYGLDPAQVTFLVQGELPCTDPRGKLLLAEVDRVAASPNGHGGAFLALRDAGGLERMAERGQELLFYWQVDNPLCRVADPVFLGAHLAAGAEASTKVVEKVDPSEKVGLLAREQGRTRVVEYTELSAEAQAERDEAGKLRYRAGNAAIHLFERAFLERVGEDYEPPFHVARKKVPCLDADGNPLVPEEANGVKFETFIFDLLPQAEGHVTFEVDREEEFEPLKNAEGPYSPETVKRALSDRAARWAEAAGHPVERGSEGQPSLTWEVSPLTALEPADLAGAVLPAPADGACSL
jgi:UDP-N-acetylglucosamine/UDP-N-acetylgalactosamine diphosphorylase